MASYAAWSPEASALAMPNSLSRDTHRPSAQRAATSLANLCLALGVPVGTTLLLTYSHKSVWTFQEQLNASCCPWPSTAVANRRFRLPMKTLGCAPYLGFEYIPSADCLAPGPQDYPAQAGLAVVTGV